MDDLTHAISDIKELRDDVDTLYKTIYQGNGVPSLITLVTKLDGRMTSLEEKLDDTTVSIDKEMTLKFKNITDVVNERFNHISFQIAQEFDKKRHDNHTFGNFKSKAFAAVIAGTCSIAAVLIAEFIKK